MMSQLKVDELKLDLHELMTLCVSAKRQRVKDLISVEIKKIETKIFNINEQIKKEQTSPQEDVKRVSVVQNRCYDVKLTDYAWDQTEESIKLYITVPDLDIIPVDKVHCDFSATSVEMSIKGVENHNYLFSLKNLLENIDVASCTWRTKKVMVVITLSKVAKGRWSFLTTTEKKDKEPKSKLPDMNSDEDPTARLMDMMRQMYMDGDDDMKRTIAQSWTESSNKSKAGL